MPDVPARRAGPILRSWRIKVQASRDNLDYHQSSDALLRMLWEEGFGPIAAARMMDWYCSSHPEVIAERQRKGGCDAEGRP